MSGLQHALEIQAADCSSMQPPVLHSRGSIGMIPPTVANLQEKSNALKPSGAEATQHVLDALQDETAAFLEGIEQVEEANRVDQAIFLLRPGGTRREATTVAAAHVLCFDVTPLGLGAFSMI